MPRPKKPDALKIITGSRRPRAQGGAVFAPLDALPPAPEWLPGGRAVAAWSRLGGVLVAQGQLTHAGLGPLAVLASVLGTIENASAAGRMALPQMRVARLLLADFGLQPGRELPPGPARSPGNAFAGRGRRG